MSESLKTVTQSAPSAPQHQSGSESLNTKDMRRILASSFIGSAIEYYDFILYATAASIVFNTVFFANLSPAFGLFASFATLAAGYLARPLGGIVFGHFGDKLGRKKMLVLSMLLMGASTVLIGLLPTTAVIGILAPVLLVTLRVIQGIAVGGEWGGAALMALESAPQKKRGLATSFATAGGPAGAVLATLVVSLTSALTGDAFLQWGWRIPFLLSAVLIAVGMIIRLKVAETPMFQKLQEAGEKKRMPLFDVLRNHPRAVVVALIATMSFYACQGILTVWGVSIAVGNGVDRSGVLNWKAAGAVLTLIMCFYTARLSDRIGRRKVLTVAGITGIVLAYPLLMLLSNGTLWGFAIAIVVGNGIVQGALFGPIGAYIAEQFPTRMRYTGASLSYQGASVLGAGFTPMIATGLMIAGNGSIWLVGAFWIAVILAGTIAVRATPEGTKVNLD
ncbi:MFS transporter [Arthrobacter crystallopoietes]|uniref:Putative proline/betaine transporter n=1 Tax=Crystallibacter crystallopoietes TaxID=37928 RepID=A0A1H1BLU5_9MICC|nr:MFS transporter [Arthrobacter crystallopoietes]SDQ52918.1 Predicted arabinose efflux permease, MFS family [Arthrobacter crystallopoietes]